MPQELFIEDVLTISIEELEDLKEKNENKVFSTDWKEISEHPAFLYCLRLFYRESQFYALFNVCHGDSLNVNGNIVFCIKSATYSAKANKWKQISSQNIIRGLSKWLACQSYSLKDVLNLEKKFIVNGNLILHVQGIIYNTSPERQKTPHPTVTYLWEHVDKDFVILVGKKEEEKTDVKIHKLVLASRSPVFDRMLETNMKEKAANKLEIIDFDVEVVQAAVEYFYDREIFKSLNPYQLIDLLQFSDKYEINDMKDAIQEILVSQIYPDTFVQIANASIIFNATMLKKFCFRCLVIYSKNEIFFDNANALDDEINNW